MPAYIIETGRSYRNPIESKDFEKRWNSDEYEGVPDGYQIRFLGAGPGSLPLGKDNVHYIGDEEEVCTNCDSDRREVYRHYRGTGGNGFDHTYTTENRIRKEDMAGERGKGKVAKKYNAEPRSNRPVFFVLESASSGGTQFYRHYNHDINNTKISSNTSEGSGWENTGTLGYIHTTESGAATHGADYTPLYHYYAGAPKYDDFYTTNPAGEVNLSGGPIPPSDPQKGEYVYQGIIGYVYTGGFGSQKAKQVVDIGLIGPTGQCVDKSGWYQWAEPWSYFRYRWGRRGDTDSRFEGPPNMNGWGDADYVEVADPDANFEWAYGLNGAIKGAVPRYLGFEDMYDSQFVYYLYDTSYPWNGPIFGIQYTLSDAGCCPNTTCTDEQERSYPCCIRTYSYHSHFYQIRQDSWETTKSTLKLSDMSTQGVNESFWTVGTDSRRIFFRYTSTTGAFRRGEEVNGWTITSVRYFGDENKAGFIDLGETDAESGNGNTFTYNQQITSADGGTAVVLAGYGIGDKCAFFGVYEFPKKVTYFQVEIDPNALVASRTLDEAKLEAVINEAGELAEVKITNGGYGYRFDQTTISVSSPGIMEDFSPGDYASEMMNQTPLNNNLSNARTPGYKQETNQDYDMQMHNAIQKTSNTLAQSDAKTAGKTVYNRGKTILQKQAKVIVEEIDANGSILRVAITDPGSGYSPDFPPLVAVVIPETVSRGFEGQDTAGFNPVSQGALKNVKDKFATDGGFDLESVLQEGFSKIEDGLSVELPQGYMKVTDVSKTDKTVLCQDLPATCLDLTLPGIVSDALPTDESFKEVRKVSDGINDYLNGPFSQVRQAAQESDQRSTALSGVYGWNGGKACIEIPQPKTYAVSRFFDMPCSYRGTSNPLSPLEDPKPVAFGWVVHKYCASEAEEATFKVSMRLEGRTVGSQGQDFMDFLKDKMPAAKLTPTRKVSGLAKTHPCFRGGIQGRCYRDPNGPGYVFVPIGLDENTFDYNRSSFSEFEQFQLWLHDNIATYTPNFLVGPWTWSFTTPNTDPQTGEPDGTSTTENFSDSTNITAIEAEPWENGAPPNECWDTYVRGVTASDGPLDVFCGWDANGQPIAGTTYDQVPELMSICAALENVNDVSIAVQPGRMQGGNPSFVLGPYVGQMKVRNYLTGATIVYSKAVQYLSNPYFSECDVGIQSVIGAGF